MITPVRWRIKSSTLYQTILKRPMFDVQVCSGNGIDTIRLASVSIGREKEIATNVMIGILVEVRRKRAMKWEVDSTYE